MASRRPNQPALAPRPDRPAGSELAELAARYLSEIRRIQPTGPYRIGGWSMGALLAHQIASQLERAGEQVASLILLDPPFAMPVESSTDLELAEQFVADALRTLGRPAEPVSRPAGSTDQVLDQLADLLANSGANSIDTRAEIARRYAVYAANRRMMSGYQPVEPVHADTVLVSARNSPNQPAVQRWPELVEAEFEAVSLDADHYTLLQPPLCHEVAAMIGKSR